MKNIIEKALFILSMAIILIVLVPRCSKLNKDEPVVPANEAPANGTPPILSQPATLYLVNCADCHGSLEASSKIGTTMPRLKSAIDNDIGDMGSLSSLTAEELQSIVDVLNPEGAPAPIPSPTSTSIPSTNGAALYTTHCASCHGALSVSRKKGTTLIRLQNAIVNDVGNMGYLSTLTSGQLQSIVTALNPIIVPPTPTPTPVPTLTPVPIPTPVVDGAALYNNNCAACHGALDVSRKKGTTLTRLHNAIVNDVGGMGYLSTLTAAEEQAIVTALIPSSTPTPTPTQTSTPVPTPTQTPTPTPTVAKCGSCHGIPPSIGRHSKHKSLSCSKCHGTGYSSTSATAATHMNGVKNITSNVGWKPASRTCANSCHGSKSW